jgi:competence protein ComFC
MWRSLLDLVFPAQCAACNAIGSGFCGSCLPSAAPIDIRLRLLRVRALGIYEDTLRDAVLALKDGRCDVAEALGILLAPAVPGGTTLIPVPTTAARKRVRGVDGVVLMARIAARAAGATMVEALRQRAGDAQRGRSRTERLRAKDRFVCEAAIAGRRVLLVDDVCTTGATLEDCAGAVRAAGGCIEGALVVAAAKPDAPWKTKPA